MIRRKDGFLGERQVVLPPMMIDVQEKDPLTKSLFITDIGYYPKAEHHHRVREKAIDQYVLIYCVEGNGWYSVDGKRYEVYKNQYFILPAGFPHEYGATEGTHWTVYWVHFCGSQASIYAEGALKPQDINVSLHSRISERISIFEEILTTLHYGDSLEDLRYASSLLHHFLASMRYLGQYRRAKSKYYHSNDKEPFTYHNHMDIVESAIHFMRENMENHLSMEEMLKYIGYSKSHFSIVFKKQMGCTPLAYFNRLKIESACELLKLTDMRMNQICYKIGMKDSLYFSRLFKKTMGMSPTEYRIRESEKA